MAGAGNGRPERPGCRPRRPRRRVDCRRLWEVADVFSRWRVGAPARGRARSLGLGGRARRQQRRPRTFALAEGAGGPAVVEFSDKSQPPGGRPIRGVADRGGCGDRPRPLAGPPRYGVGSAPVASSRRGTGTPGRRSVRGLGPCRSGRRAAGRACRGDCTYQDLDGTGDAGGRRLLDRATDPDGDEGCGAVALPERRAG